MNTPPPTLSPKGTETSKTAPKSRRVFNPSQRRERENARMRMSAEEYFEAYHIKKYIHDCVYLLTDLPNVDPLSFCATYFESARNGKNVAFRHFKYVNATPSNRLHFIRAFRRVFKDIPKERRLTPECFHQLLCLLCPDFPSSLVRNASRVTTDTVDTSTEVPFYSFSLRFFTLFFFAEFMNQAALKFRDLDTQVLGKVSSSQFQTKLLKIVKEKGSVFSCPQPDIVCSVLDSFGTPSIMFNSFCVKLFEHPSLSTHLVDHEGEGVLSILSHPLTSPRRVHSANNSPTGKGLVSPNTRKKNLFQTLAPRTTIGNTRTGGSGSVGGANKKEKHGNKGGKTSGRRSATLTHTTSERKR